MAAVTYVHRHSQSDVVGFPSADPAVTSSFTPGADERLLVIVGGVEQLALTQDFTGSWSISDSQGLTWTSIDAVASTTSKATGMRAWVSSPAAASAMTITLDCSFYMFISNEFVVFGLTGATGSVDGYVENNAAATDGGYTRTLAAAPTTDDLSIFARYIDADGACTLDMDTGWTVATPATSIDTGTLSVAVRPSDTSTTVTIDDTRTNAQTVRKAIDFAFIVKAPVAVNATAGVASGAGDAPDPGVSAAQSAELASSTGDVPDPGASAAQAAALAAATGDVPDPTISTSMAVVAEVASATGDAPDPVALWNERVAATVAQTTGQASASGTSVEQGAWSALSLGLALEPSITIPTATVLPDTALGWCTANGGTADTEDGEPGSTNTATPDPAEGQGTARTPRVVVVVHPGAAGAQGRAITAVGNALSSRIRVHAGSPAVAGIRFAGTPIRIRRSS